MFGIHHRREIKSEKKGESQSNCLGPIQLLDETEDPNLVISMEFFVLNLFVFPFEEGDKVEVIDSEESMKKK